MNKNEAANAFGVTDKQVSFFKRVDPFNDIEVEGWICRKRNKNGGSLVITKVDGWNTKQIVWATPKLAYPYRDGGTDLIDFRGDVAGFYMSEKWNGMNILFYKYFNKDGKRLVTAKSKGTPFVGDSDAGNFLTMLKGVLGKYFIDIHDDFSKARAAWLEDDTAQGLSCEMCGTDEPHLVKYDFVLELKPLFTIHENGRVKPVINLKEKSNGYGNIHYSFDSTHDVNEKESVIHGLIRGVQGYCFSLNEQYRADNNLLVKYEYDHFITEGMVLYVLDSNGFVKNRTMYKIKPKDIEEVHWQRFDETMEARVDEAIKKCVEREYEVNEENIREELDMGPKEWGKFGRTVMKFVEVKNEKSS